MVHIAVVLAAEHQTVDKVHEAYDVESDGTIVRILKIWHHYVITYSYVCINCNSENIIDLNKICISLYVHVNSLYDCSKCLLCTVLCIIQDFCLVYSGFVFVHISSVTHTTTHIGTRESQ